MKADYLHEPELEFGAGGHIDIRFGLMNYGPLDVERPTAPRPIRVGCVGTAETLEGLNDWLERCRQEIAAKPSRSPNLFPRFPGFNLDVAFRSTLLCDKQTQRQLSSGVLRDVLTTRGQRVAIGDAVSVFLQEMRNLVENSNVDVFLIAPPAQLDRGMAEANEREDGQRGGYSPVTTGSPSFHDLLKARAMPLAKPLQLVFPATYGGRVRRQRLDRPQLQDEATRAWNLHTALYYKAGGIPWRLLRDPLALTSCFLGVSFFESADREMLHTSVAQIFNERGEGIIVRGAQAAVSKADRQPHLTEKDAYDLFADALRRYRDEHHALPARVVIHKTSNFSPAEVAGFVQCATAHLIDSVDLVTLARSSTRLFRAGAYPPLRGTVLLTDDGLCFAYTRGSVDFYAVYPGLYVPRPLQLRIERSDQTPRFLAREVLELTKLNWNSTQFDNSDPITVRAARQVGAILKHVGNNEVIQHRYGYYM